jgi:hypothetical protein
LAHRIRFRLVEATANLPQSGTAVRIAEHDDGDPAILGRLTGRGGEIEIPGIAGFFFSRSSKTVAVRRAPGASPDDVDHSFFATALPLILQATSDVEAFHASAVLHGGRVVAFCGVSGAGKSTLAESMARKGCPVWGVDAVAFTAGDDGIRSVPLPYLDERPEFADSSAANGGRPALRLAGPPRPEADESPFAAVFVLSPTKSGLPVVDRLRPSEALVALLPNSYRFRPQPADRERATLQAYLDFVSSTPVFRLTYVHARSLLPRTLEMIEQTVASPEVASS